MIRVRGGAAIIGAARRLCEADRPYDWREAAGCAQTDPELFFPIGYKSGPDLLQIEQARAVCKVCPVKAECLDWAIDSKIPDGILGGLTPDERSIFKRKGE